MSDGTGTQQPPLGVRLLHALGREPDLVTMSDEELIAFRDAQNRRVPVLDPVADHGRAYVQRLREAGTPARLAEHARAGHAFLSVPGLVPAARPARREILAFLRTHLHPATSLTGVGER